MVAHFTSLWEQQVFQICRNCDQSMGLSAFNKFQLEIEKPPQLRGGFSVLNQRRLEVLPDLAVVAVGRHRSRRWLDFGPIISLVPTVAMC